MNINEDRNIEEEPSWFASLSSKRKLIFGLLIAFVVGWCFFLGFHVSGMLSEAKAGEQFFLTGRALNTEEDDSFEPVELTGFRTILAVGYDIREGETVGRSDTIMLAFLNLDDKSIKLLSIPRDSYVNIPGGFGRTKINHAFSYGGITLTKETVEYLLGITIDDYVTIDFKGFKDVVDAIGGVVIDVDMDMYNYWEDIELYEGPQQLLDGRKALGFCRYRGADCSDYQRIGHQQTFLRALAKKLLTFKSLTKLKTLVNIGMENVTTTISSKDMLDLAQYAFSMDLDGMETYTIPGYSMYIQYGGYWLSHEIINQTELTRILNQIAGDDIVFSPNVIDDGGLGVYSIPDDGEEYVDDDMTLDPDGSEYEGDSGGDEGGDSGGGDEGGDEGGGDSGGDEGGDSGGGDEGGDEGGGDSGGFYDENGNYIPLPGN